ncbi:MAG: hypothetical protein N2446_03590, partial [Elusimicrobiales bacterium]|nr:hypothetical protein [Elusimicrobiales bacterium]
MDLNSFYVFSKRFNSIDDSVFKYIEKNIFNLKQKMYSKNISEIVEILDKVGKVFSDKNSIYYKLALKDLMENIKFSKQMIKETLEIVPQILSKSSLQKRLSLELMYPKSLDSLIDRYNYDGYLKVYPKGVVFHVGAGNVFIGILDSLINGIITKNINIVKISSKGSNFMNIFSYAVEEVDKKSIIADSFAIFKWKGGEEKDIERKILSFSDLVVVWGGYDVSEYYKKNTPFNVDLEIFGPKTSFGIIFEDYLMKIGYKEAARRIVKDCAMWDQGACSNMHDLYIICDEKKRDIIVKNLMEEIEIAFKEFEKKLPCGRIDPDEMVEILKARELAKVDSSFSNSKLVF